MSDIRRTARRAAILRTARLAAREAWHHPIPLLTLYLASSIIAAPFFGAASGAGGPAEPAYSVEQTLVLCFLLYRVFSGGRVSRMILLLLTSVSCAEAALVVARYWQDAGYLAVFALQFAILVNPAVHRRNAGRSRSWPAWPRRLPPRRALALSVLAGLLITVAFLGYRSVGRPAEPGCQAGHPAPCAIGQHGYPVPVLSGGYGLPLFSAQASAASARAGESVFSAAGFARDWAQWTLVAFTFPYGLWLAFGRREELPLSGTRVRNPQLTDR